MHVGLESAKKQSISRKIRVPVDTVAEKLYEDSY